MSIFVVFISFCFIQMNKTESCRETGLLINHIDNDRQWSTQYLRRGDQCLESDAPKPVQVSYQYLRRGDQCVEIEQY
jgi:hypothetical protein